MALTLHELLASFNTAVQAVAAPPATPSVDPYDRAWWVVVVNPRRVPARAKFVASFDAETDAVAERDRRTAMEDTRVADVHEYDLSHRPYTFHVIQRPDAGRDAL